MHLLVKVLFLAYKHVIPLTVSMFWGCRIKNRNTNTMGTRAGCINPGEGVVWYVENTLIFWKCPMLQPFWESKHSAFCKIFCCVILHSCNQLYMGNLEGLKQEKRSISMQYSSFGSKGTYHKDLAQA